MSESERTILVLGPGDDIDRAIIRALASEGIATVATSTLGNPYDLSQHGVDVPHWTSEEGEIDERVSSRMLAFLKDQGRSPSAVVVHVELPEAEWFPKSRTWKDWWSTHPSATSFLLRGLRTAMAAIPPNGACSIVLLYRLASHSDANSIHGWLNHTMESLLTAARDRQVVGVRVNAVLIGAGEVHSDSAEVVRFLCSRAAAQVSGAFIPIGDDVQGRDDVRPLSTR